MPARVLVVEDDRFIREVVAIALRADGYEVDVAFDGDLACRYLAVHQPAAIILDLALPYVDGLTICRRLRAAPGTASLPVLATSAAPGDDAARAALAAGANGFLHKPFDLGELIERVGLLIPVRSKEEHPVPGEPLVSRPSDAAANWRMAIEGQTARDRSE
jgi:two-component system, OmpR family, response regulator MprA